MIGPFIFLDIDGVLNGHNRHANGYCGCDADSVRVMNELIDRTQAKVIVSSAWRYFVLRGEMNIAGLGGLLCTHGLKWGCVVDVLGPDVPDGNGGADRGRAIKDWFNAKFGVASAVRYIAIDDMDLGYTKHAIPWFKTDTEKGFGGTANRRDFDRIETELKR